MKKMESLELRYSNRSDAKLALRMLEEDPGVVTLRETGQLTINHIPGSKVVRLLWLPGAHIDTVLYIPIRSDRYRP